MTYCHPIWPAEETGQLAGGLHRRIHSLTHLSSPGTHRTGRNGSPHHLISDQINAARDGEIGDLRVGGQQIREAGEGWVV
jgi:hypothetical protein